MTDAFSTTQDLRDLAKEVRDEMRRTSTFQGETTTSLLYLRQGVDSLTENGCSKGIDDRARIKAIEKSLDAMVTRPSRRAAVWGGSAAGGATIVGLILQWLANHWQEWFGGS